ncbi:MAG: DUF2092 domain-containing protein [Terrimicrobiaceae bacterium]
MKQNSILAVLGLALAAASPSLTFAANGTPSTTAEQSRADTILRQMSNTLGAAQYFSFKVDREIDPPLAKKLGLQERTRIEVAVRRPDKLVALSTSKADVRKLFADGRQLTVFDVKQNLYSTVPMPASLDALPAKLAEKYGFAPPLAEFVVSDPYKDILWRIKSQTYLGTVRRSSGFLNQVECHRVALSGSLADAELWIAVTDHLPRKLTARISGSSGDAGGLTIVFSDWNMAAKLPDRAFVFTPSKNAQQIPMITTSEMRAAMKR